MWSDIELICDFNDSSVFVKMNACVSKRLYEYRSRNVLTQPFKQLMRPTDDDSKEKSLPRKASMKVAEDLQSKLSRVRHKAESEGQVWTNSPRNRWALDASRMAITLVL